MATKLDKEVVQIIGKPKKSEIAGFGTCQVLCQRTEQAVRIYVE